MEQHIFRVETARSGPFTFQLGLDLSSVAPLLARIEDVHELFKGSPLATVANSLEKEVLTTSIYGTNTIEGGKLSEEETAEVLEMDPAKLKEEEARRVANMKRAYDLAKGAAKAPSWALTPDFIRQVHVAITEGLESVEKRNTPGHFRDNHKGTVTQVGSEATGGSYKPPQYGADIEKLIEALCQWNTQLEAAGIPPLVRAPLVHLYFELIHPFWDGNGRVGRVLEATILLAAGYRYAPFALARYYLEEIHQYFGLFNSCRRAAEKKAPSPLEPFVIFHLEGMLKTIKALQNRVNRMVAALLFRASLSILHEEKLINTRQFTIACQLMEKPLPIDKLRAEPWYQALYIKVSDRTRQRDLTELKARDLIKENSKGVLCPAW
ncbi:Fic family protein [Oryzomicrobium sp.]|uniref:Fic family protein n=1 Tax=Oryzomicrobium sp. TaxID=1911578 RepID=UPI002FDF5AFE